MKKIKFIFPSLLTLLLMQSCYVGRFVYWNLADIRDYKKFPYMMVDKPEQPFKFKTDTTKYKFDTITYKGVLYKFDDFLEKDKTVAFLIIKNDTILYEKYFDNYNEASIVPSFSAAKSYVGALAGIAIEEGYIKSVDQPITDFLPELKKNDERFSKITIENLLNMRTGILYKESYINPFGNVARSYYGKNLLGQLKRLKIKEDPDKEFEYISESPELLALIIERATGKKLTEYLQEKIWKPLGMEFDASWSIDSKKHKEAKAFCCLNARARDYAKFGRLYLNGGNWNGTQIIPEAWVKTSTQVNKDTKGFFYSYLWWHNVTWEKINDTTATVVKTDTTQLFSETDKKGVKNTYLLKPMNDFFANGLLGQFIYVYPAKKVIIVRLGKSTHVGWTRIFYNLARSL
jgi:CubicO group peptidase (beta-lactamase class C family)